MPSEAVEFRALHADDAPAVAALARRTWADLRLRVGRPEPSDPEAGVSVAAVLRIRHLIATDPGGAFAAERDGSLVGAALALLREEVWGLSLLVVDPGAQSAGIGSELLSRALAYGADMRGGIILSSEDHRALRSYARAGFAVHPVIEADGVPRPLELPSYVRPGGPEDLALADEVDRAVRGAAHGRDIGAMLAAGLRMLVAPGRGYVLSAGGEVRLLAALDEPAAQDLLRAAIALTPDGARASVDWVSAHQAWAMPVLLEAGLQIRVGGAVFVRGDVGRFVPYLPSGAYL